MVRRLPADTIALSEAWSIPEAARLSGIPKTTLMDMIRSDRLRVFLSGCGQKFVLLSDVRYGLVSDVEPDPASANIGLEDAYRVTGAARETNVPRTTIQSALKLGYFPAYRSGCGKEFVLLPDVRFHGAHPRFTDRGPRRKQEQCP